MSSFFICLSPSGSSLCCLSTHRCRNIHWTLDNIPGTTVLRKIDSPLASSHQLLKGECTQAPPQSLWKCWLVQPIQVFTGKHSYCSFMRATISSCTDDSLSLWFSLLSWSYSVSTPLSLCNCPWTLVEGSDWVVKTLYCLNFEELCFPVLAD